MKKILEVKHLKVSPINDPRKILVDDVSFDLYPGRTTCIVGESGSGKSLTALSIMKLLSTQLKQTGDIYFEGKNISQLSNVAMRHYRGKSMAMIFQEPMTSLNPVISIGDQIKEALSVHLDLDKKSLDKKVVLNSGGNSFKSQMKRADKSGAAFAVILGDDEMKEGVAQVKSLRVENVQSKIPLDELAQFLLKQTS